MDFNSYVVSETKIAETSPIVCPPPYKNKGFGYFSLKRKAFTLAETLITLTIIGVVVALTIPTLLTKYQHHVWASQVIKTHSDLQAALPLIPLSQNCPAGDYECANLGQSGAKNATLFYNALKNYKDCTTSSKNCLKERYIAHGWDIARGAGNETEGIWGTRGFSKGTPAVVSPSGVFVYFLNDNTINIDVNGPQKPNTYGRDVFMFALYPTDSQYKNMVVPLGSKIFAKKHLPSLPDYCTWDKGRRCDSKHLTELCAGRILEKRKMDY